MTRSTLHIGTTKTGSSSIQHFLADNRETLASQGALYPKALGNVSHNVIPVATKGQAEPTDHQRLYKITTKEDYQAFVEDRRKSLIREIDYARPDHILISSEHMHSRCLSAAHFSRLKRLLAPALDGPELQIVVYLRPQIEHAISLYSTMLSHGLTLDIDSFLEQRMSGRKRRYHDFRKLIETWQEAFPDAKMTVRAFNTVESLPEGVITDFMQVARLDNRGVEYPHRVNKSLSAWSAEALRTLNAMAPSLSAAEARKMKHWLRTNGSQERLLPDPDLSRRFQDSFSAENDWVMSRFLPDVPDALEPNWTRLNTAAPRPEISAAELRNILSEVLPSGSYPAPMAEREPKSPPQNNANQNPQATAPTVKVKSAKTSIGKTIHFLHIGKAAGSQIKYLANQINAAQTKWQIKTYPHHVDLKDLPTRKPYFFSIRHPLSRFSSGFYSRKRKGQPRLLVEWSAHEKCAFEAFEHANDLAEALFEDSPRGAAAFSAINSINHTAKGQVDWFFKRGFLFDIRPPVWIIRQEHFAADWSSFLDRIGIGQHFSPTEDKTSAHRNDYSDVPTLTDLAQGNLRRWYCQDIELYKHCEDWIARQSS